MGKLITILIPAYNEEEVVDVLHERLVQLADTEAKYQFEFLFIDDGSKDETSASLLALRENDKRINLVCLSRNFGKETAMMAGFDYSQGDAVVIIDADLQDPPELISDMLRLWEEGYDDVYAKRISRNGESWLKKLTSKVYYRLLQKMTRIPVQQDTGDFRLLDRRCIEALKSMRESQRYTKGMFSWIGYKKKEILYERDARAAGTTKWNYYQLINLAIEGITSFTISPLRISSFLGCIVSGVAYIYILILVIKTLLYGNETSGYPSLMCAILFMGGIQLIMIGVLGEYIGRIFSETKKRPLYLVDEYNGKKESILDNHVYESGERDEK